MGSPVASSSPSIPAIELEVDLHRDQILEVQQTLSSLQISFGKALENLTQQQSSFQQTLLDAVHRLPPSSHTLPPITTAPPISFGSVRPPPSHHFPQVSSHASSSSQPFHPRIFSPHTSLPSAIFTTPPPYTHAYTTQPPSTHAYTTQPPYSHVPITQLVPPPLFHTNPPYTAHRPYQTTTLASPHTPKIDLYRFTGKDPYAWLTTAERYLDLHEIPPHLQEFWSVEMCNYQPWEEDSLQSEDYVQSTAEGVDVAETRWGARLAMLEARVTRVEARVERLEAKMLHLQKGMRVVCALFLVTLMYAIFK